MTQKEWETLIGHGQPKFRCDRCRTAFSNLESWPTHPRQGYAMCPYCGDVVTKYVRKMCSECDGEGYLTTAPNYHEPCVSCGSTGSTLTPAAEAK